MFRIAWLSFKLLLSIALVAMVIGLLWHPSEVAREPAVLGIAGVFLFLAALPWVNLEHSNRAVGLVGIVFSLAFFIVAGSFFTGHTHLPKACNTRSKSFCELMNYLYLLGGPYLAAAPILCLAAFFLYASIHRLRSHSARSNAA